MDWTGGVRRRYTRGKGTSALQKQKAYFARARAELQNPKASQHVLSPDFLSRGPPSSRGSQSRTKLYRSSLTSRHRVAASSLRRPLIADTDFRRGSEASAQRSGQRNTNARAHSRVSISSDTPSSSGESPPASRRHGWRLACSAPRAAVDEEERLLVVKRRRLLARTDWLGLHSRKPAQMSFGSARDKDCIGKRRKIQRTTSHADGKARLRSISPLRQAAYFDRDHIIPRMVRPEDIEIKIGTDALKSQTQVSQHSRTPDRMTLGRPSTGLTALSEEPMLLGYEENSHLVTELSEQTGTQLLAPDVGSLACVAGSQITTAQQSAYDPRIYMQQQNPTHAPSPRQPIDNPVTLESADISNVVIEHDNPTGTHERKHSTVYYAPSEELELSVDAHPGVLQTQGENSDVDEYDYHRCILHILPRDRSHDSLAAVRLLSLERATSYRNAPQELLDDALTGTSSVSRVDETPPPVADTGGFTILHKRAQTSVAGLQSPSTSFKAIERLACQPPAPRPVVDVEDEKEAAWRQFIIGSQDSSWESSPDHVPRLTHSDEDTLMPDSIHSSNFSISGLGTSMKATMGNANSTVGDPSNSELHGKSSDPEEEVSEAGDTSVACHIDTSVADHGVYESDFSEEEAQSKARREGPTGNFHALPPKVLNPRRFKRAKGQLVAPSKKPQRFLSSMHVRVQARENRFSVYDVLESE